ncbi:hypothetical protein CDD82_2108 [Ophiocordyceps australis]|uniref:Uncharacterized protein n=1 Tax=Ophiocordyceps australis TaxID=1399860 RepID=A0A2C5ZJ46_9HYPO|nr:hypothetical protein CDD82_2108 [Ophiocordyceps australis]
MGSLHGLEEFYVTCNPPLLQHGVRHVIQSTTQALTDKIIEMLYEPEIPWFKVITLVQHRQLVKDFIHRLLLQITEEDSELLSYNQATTYAELDSSLHSLRILPWSEMQHGLSARIALYDCHRFPEDMQPLTYKTVWRGLEACNGWKLDMLLAIISSQWGHMGAPSCTQDLDSLLQCTISHNLQSTMVYLGTSQSAATLDKAIKVLDNLLRLAVYASHSWKHSQICHLMDNSNQLRLVRYDNVLAPEGSGTFRFVYNWLSHLGHDSTTYVLGRLEETEREYKRMATAVTIRAEREADNETWKPDTSRYEGRGGLKSSIKIFSAFEEYNYAAKAPAKVTALFEVIDKLSQGQFVPSQEERLPDATVSTKSSGPSNAATLNKTSQCHPDTCRVETVESRAESTLYNLLDDPSEDISTSNFVQNWIDDATCSKATQPLQTEDLISFDEAPGPRAQTICTNESRDSLQQADTLINLHDDARFSASSEFDSCMQQPDLLGTSPPHQLSLGPVEDNMLSTQFFGVQPDISKDIRRTMNQRAGQPSSGRNALNYPALPRTSSPSGREGRPCTHAWQNTHHAAGQKKEEDRDATPPKAVKSEAREGPTSAASSSLGLWRVTRPLLASQELLATNDTLLQLVKTKTKDLYSTLHLIPGTVSLDVKFGRVYIKDMGAALVSTGSGPYFVESQMIDSLLVDQTQPNRFAFSTILSTAGFDADTLTELQPAKGGRWTGCDKVVWYEFECVSDEHGKFVVEVDAQTLAHQVRRPQREVGTLNIHCVHRPWDIQVCVSHVQTLEKSPIHAAIADALAASVSIRADKTGEVFVETTTDPRLQASIEGVYLRHVARYNNTARTSSILSINMTKKLARAEKQERRMKWKTVLKNGQGTGSPPIWYEAYISSQGAQELLSQNAGLSLGEQASYDGEVLENKGVSEDLCRPALYMITQMNGIGAYNNNGHGVQMRTAPGTGPMEENGPSSYRDFW